MAKKKSKQRRGNNEGCVYQLKNGSWGGYAHLGRDENGKPIRKYVYAPTEEEANYKVKQLTGKISTVRLESFQNSFCDLMKEWLLVFKINEVTSRVFEDVMRNFKLHIKPYLENMSILEVDTVVIKKLLNQIYTKNKSKDVQRKVKTLLKQFFDYAVEEKLVQYNPVLSVKIKNAEKKDYSLENKENDYKAIKPEHRKKYFEALKQNDFLLTLCCVGYYMGLRIGEILALKWSDFDLENGIVKIDKGITYEVKFDKEGNVLGRKTIVSSPKTEVSVALLPISEVLQDSLKNWYALQKEKSKKLKVNLVTDDDYIFCNDDKSIRTYDGTKSIYYRFLKRNGLTTKEFHFHALRHTFGTILKDNKQSLYDIQMLLRHANARTTERYLSINVEKALALKDKLNNVFENAEKQDIEEEQRKKKRKKDFEM